MSWADRHAESERLANAAEVALRSGNITEAESLYRRAAESEWSSLTELDSGKLRTLGITAVSAVALAYKGRDPALAQRFAYTVLQQQPLPPFAVAQIRDLLQIVWSEETIAAAGLTFSKNDVLVAVKGGQIMTGGAPLDLILRKVEEIRAIFYRTVELLMNLPIRLRGGPSYDIQQLFRPWLFQAPAGSYQFAVRLESAQQLELFHGTHVPGVDDVTNKFVEILSSAATDPEQALTAAVPSEEYRSAFLKLTRNLAPTGKAYSELEIKSKLRPELPVVTFVPDDRKAINDTIRRSVPERRHEDAGIAVTLTGILRAVHLDQDWLEVTVTDPIERHVRVEKAGEVIDDVVGPMINRPVQVSALKLSSGKTIFQDIEPME